MTQSMPPTPPRERPFRLEIAPLPGARDPRGEAAAHRCRRDLDLELTGVESRDVYLLDCDLTGTEPELVVAALEDPVVQQARLGCAPAEPFTWAIGVGYKPGVTDNVGSTARVAVADVVGRPLAEDEAVYASVLYLIRGEIDRDQAMRIAVDVLANPLIQSIELHSYEEWRTQTPDTGVPRITSRYEPEVALIDLALPDDELIALSRSSLWALTPGELHAIRDHFAAPEQATARRVHGLGSEPTDVEIETLAQTWSEHCKHKIFNSTLDYEDTVAHERRSIPGLFDTFIRGATEVVSCAADWLLSVFTDNAGVIRFTPDTNLVYKVETHNTPSALDPYGGAMTGIVGVNRDPFGTGRGADLLINTWGYCFASPFYEGEVPEGLMPPRRIRDGVHQGVIDGGNQSGIPYGRGWELFDERYLGKPLVYCGTVGIMPAALPDGSPSHEKIVHPGDAIVMVGGRIGADGIHGATFSSQELHAESPSQAVQIGDPITQKKMTDFLLEALAEGLFTTITDNGAGGLSSSVGEMARATGGAELDLARAPLKYPGLMPWEILLSEAQERMTVGVPQEKLEAFLSLAARREVEATPLGEFTASGYFHVRYGDRTVALLDMEFLHDGWPKPVLPARWEAPQVRPLPPIEATPGDVLRDLLTAPNLASKEYTCRQYDHEVKARTVVKPLTGIAADTPADATVFLVDYDRPEGVVLAEGINPYYSDIDTRGMALVVVDEAVRRLVAAGARPGTIAALDNFCWPDPVESETTPDGRYKLAQLVRACEGLHEACVAYGVPLISGKDSMKNDSTRGGVKISIPPTLLLSAMGRIDDARQARTPEPKAAGDIVYLLGLTRAELGGSEFARRAETTSGWTGTAPVEGADTALAGLIGPETVTDAAVGGALPAVPLAELAERYIAVHQAIAAGLPASVKTPTLGGLAIALTFMAFGAERGLAIDLDSQPVEGELDLWERLFAESTGRFVFTVESDRAEAFEAALADQPLAPIGLVTPEPRLVLTWNGERIIDEDILNLKQVWQAPFAAL